LDQGGNVHFMNNRADSELRMEKTEIVCPQCGQAIGSEFMHGGKFVLCGHVTPDGIDCPGSGYLAKNRSKFLIDLTDVRRVAVRNVSELIDAIAASMDMISRGSFDIMITLWDGRIVEPVFAEGVVNRSCLLEIKRKGLWHREEIKRTLFDYTVQEGGYVVVLMTYGSEQWESCPVKWRIKWRHPEQEKDEVFLGNDIPEELELTRWKTKRVGRYPFSPNGRMQKGRVPVFVKIEEMQSTGVHSEFLKRLLESQE
jgi:hypothetical protein